MRGLGCPSTSRPVGSAVSRFGPSPAVVVRGDTKALRGREVVRARFRYRGLVDVLAPRSFVCSSTVPSFHGVAIGSNSFRWPYGEGSTWNFDRAPPLWFVCMRPSDVSRKGPKLNNTSLTRHSILLRSLDQVILQTHQSPWFSIPNSRRCPCCRGVLPLPKDDVRPENGTVTPRLWSILVIPML